MIVGVMKSMEEELKTDQEFFDLLTGSYARLTGKEIVSTDTLPTWLYEEAPFAVLAHNTDADPRFIYANVTAQRLFGYPWSEFVRLPSRLSAKAPNRKERQRLLDAVSKNGFVNNYRGVRTTRAAREFWMEDGVVWQLVDESGKLRGQAAAFSKWSFAD